MTSSKDCVATDPYFTHSALEFFSPLWERRARIAAQILCLIQQKSRLSGQQPEEAIETGSKNAPNEFTSLHVFHAARPQSDPVVVLRRNRCPLRR